MLDWFPFIMVSLVQEFLILTYLKLQIDMQVEEIVFCVKGSNENQWNIKSLSFILPEPYVTFCSVQFTDKTHIKW